MCTLYILHNMIRLGEPHGGGERVRMQIHMFNHKQNRLNDLIRAWIKSCHIAHFSPI